MKVFDTTKEVVSISHRNLPLHLTTAKVLFSGDGAAMLPDNENDIFVKDFIKVILAAEEFHRRWMGSEAAKRDWCERVSKMDIDMLALNMGLFFRDSM